MLTPFLRTPSVMSKKWKFVKFHGEPSYLAGSRCVTLYGSESPSCRRSERYPIGTLPFFSRYPIHGHSDSRNDRRASDASRASGKSIPIGILRGCVEASRRDSAADALVSPARACIAGTTSWFTVRNPRSASLEKYVSPSEAGQSVTRVSVIATTRMAEENTVLFSSVRVANHYQRRQRVFLSFFENAQEDLISCLLLGIRKPLLITANIYWTRLRVVKSISRENKFQMKRERRKLRVGALIRYIKGTRSSRRKADRLSESRYCPGGLVTKSHELPRLRCISYIPFASSLYITLYLNLKSSPASEM